MVVNKYNHLKRKRIQAQLTCARKARMEAKKPGKRNEAHQIRFWSKPKVSPSKFYISNQLLTRINTTEAADVPDNLDNRMFALLHYFCCAIGKVREKKLCSYTIFHLYNLFLWCTIKNGGGEMCSHIAMLCKYLNKWFNSWDFEPVQILVCPWHLQWS